MERTFEDYLGHHQLGYDTRSLMMVTQMILETSPDAVDTPRRLHHIHVNHIPL